MIQQALNGMIAIMMAKLMLNDVPHYLFSETTHRRIRIVPPTPPIKYSLSQRPDEEIPSAKIIKVEAQVAGKVVGVITGRIYPPTRSGSIVAIVVDEGFRRKGIGTYILGKILEECKREGIKRVVATWPSEEGEKLLLKYGFRQKDEVLVFDIL